MYERIKEYSKSMNDQDYLRFVSAMSGFVDYNRQRADFKQTEGAGLGSPTAFEQITKSSSGICGDIHSMAAKMGEARGWETFTVGYALKKTQHIVTAMTNPKEPGKLMIVNYGGYEEQNLEDGNVKMQQIATVPTALGSLMKDLFKRENQIATAMPSNENYRIEKAGSESYHRELIENISGNKITDKTAGEGIVIYEGETDGAHVFGVAVSHDVYKDLYRWDPIENKCVLKKISIFLLELQRVLLILIKIIAKASSTHISM